MEGVKVVRISEGEVVNGTPVRTFTIRNVLGKERDVQEDEFKSLVDNETCYCHNMRWSEEKGRFVSLTEFVNEDIGALLRLRWAEEEAHIAPTATFVIVNDKVYLDKLLIKDGSYTIPSFVSGFKPAVFSGCRNLVLSNESKITDMCEMFRWCEMVSLTLKDFDTSKVTNMHGMFRGAQIGTFVWYPSDTSNVTDMSYMFYNTGGTRPFSCTWLNTSSVTDMSHMFAYSERTKIDISKFDTKNLINMEGMFSCCDKLTEVDMHGLNLQHVTDFSRLFASDNKLETVDMRGVSTKNITNMTEMFDFCESLETILYDDKFSTCNVKSMRAMFRGTRMSSSVKKFITDMDLSHVTNMSRMFEEIRWTDELVRLIDNLDTSNVTSMSGMFRDCGIDGDKLTGRQLKFRHLNTAKVKNFSYMFKCSQDIETIDLSCLDTSSATNMTRMFAWGEDLKSVNLSSFDIPSVENGDDIFRGCPKTLEAYGSFSGKLAKMYIS